MDGSRSYPSPVSGRTGAPTVPTGCGSGEPAAVLESDEIGPRSGHPRAHRAHRALAHPRRLLVGHAQHLGEDEGAAPPRLELRDQVRQGDVTGMVGLDHVLGSPGGAGVPTPLALPGPDLVEAYVPCDAQEPCPCRSIAPEALEPPYGPDERFL